MPDPQRHAFFGQLARVLNSGQSRSVILGGNVYDVFHDGTSYVPLIPFLCAKARTPGLIQIVYELNGPIRVMDERQKLKNAYIAWKTGQDPTQLLLADLKAGKSRSDYERHGEAFEQQLLEAIGNATLALEFLRQLTICSRTSGLSENLLILIEAADMLLPAGGQDLASLNDRQTRRISIVQDWFCDPGFVHGRDSVVLIAESRSQIHPRVTQLPQVSAIDIPSPDTFERKQYIDDMSQISAGGPPLCTSSAELAGATAGLSLHAVRQLLAAAAHEKRTLAPGDVVEKLADYIQKQLGEDVVEFLKPTHTLENVIGFRQLKKFLREEFIPRFRAEPEKALSGAAVAGPIGGGKTYIFEAVASELGAPVLVLKNLRSQWFGQTDVIFERLRRALEAIDRIVIFVDEADTQFGSLGEESHSTERRLTGKIQAMMSDTRLRGRVMWLLMTARIHRLSPDIRRPGRVGDLIIPVLDPAGEDRRDFLRWVMKGALPEATESELQKADELTVGYSAAAFSSLRSVLKARDVHGMAAVEAIVRDLLPADIGPVRRYQTLQALVNCTRRSLLPDPNITDADRLAWQRELMALEAQGIQ